MLQVNPCQSGWVLDLMLQQHQIMHPVGDFSYAGSCSDVSSHSSGMPLKQKAAINLTMSPDEETERGEIHRHLHPEHC
jgi:hypothetical protein